jgi:hypothetical protein
VIDLKQNIKKRFLSKLNKEGITDLVQPIIEKLKSLVSR